MNPLLALPLAAAITIAALGASVLVRHRRRPLNQLFFVFCCALVAWTLGGFILSHQITEERALFWARISQYGLILAPALFLHVVSVIFDLGRRSLLVPVYVAAGFLGLATHLGFVVQEVQRVQYSTAIAQWYAIGGPWRPLLVLYALLVTSVVMALLFVTARRSLGRRRTQARYLLLAAGLAFAGGLHDFFGVAGVHVYPSTTVPMYPIGSLAMVVWAAIPAYTLHRWRLVDIDVAVARSVATLLVLFVLLMTGYAALLGAQRAYFGRVDAEFSTIALTVILAATFIFPRLRVVARESIENVLFVSEKDYQNALYSLSRASTSMVDLNQLLELLCDTLTSTHGVMSACVYIDDGKGNYRLGGWRGPERPALTLLAADDSVLTRLSETGEPIVGEEVELESAVDPKWRELADRMSALEAEVALPLDCSDRFVGAIFLGPKEGGGVFTSDDLQRFMILSNHLAVALLNARLYGDLTRSQEIIRQSDRLSAIGTMAAVLAHEIRNPLVSIRTFTQLLPERYQDQDFRSSFLELTLSEVDRISGLINELLAFARPAPVKFERVDVNGAVDRISRLLDTQAKNKGVSLEIELADGLPPATADEDQIKQVMMNVIMNAIEACNEGDSVRVSSSERFTHGTTYVAVEIRDTGCGIAADKLEQVFDPFFTTRRDGTGLGLAIAQQIVTRHGGFIEVESEPGKGTTFRVNLPVDAPPMTARTTRLAPPEPGVHG